MLVTPLPIVMEIRLLQPENADPPMLVTLLGIVTEVRHSQEWYLQLVVFQFVLLKTVEKWLYGFY